MIKLIESNMASIQSICRKNNVDRLYLFGSSTDTSVFGNESDIDILVSFRMEEISLEEYTESYFNLESEFGTLLKREIDITTERSLSNPYFIKELEQTKVLIFDYQKLNNEQQN